MADVQKQKKMRKNGEIEFWRLIFSIAVVFFHCQVFLPKEGTVLELIPRGSVAVEFFFILSGFLMARSAAKKEKSLSSSLESGTKRLERGAVGKAASEYMLKRYASLFVYLIPANILLVIEKLTSKNSEGIYTVVKTALETLCLSQAGLFFQDMNAPAWYLSVLILCSAMIYPFLISHPIEFKRIVAPLIVALLYGYLQNTYKGLGSATTYDGFFSRGMLRGLAGISLGIFAFEVCQWFKTVPFSKLSRLLITAAEIGLWAVIFWYAQWDTQGLRVFMIVFALAVNIIIIFSGKSYLSRLFDFPIFAWFGELSLVIYVNHTVVRRMILRFSPYTNYYVNSFLLLFLTSLLSVLMIGMVHGWKKLGGVRGKLRNFFLDPSQEAGLPEETQR